MLNMGLNENQIELKQRVRAFVEENIIPKALKHDETGEFPIDIVKAAGKEGLLDFAVPKEFGGPGLDALSIALISEELGRGCVSMATTIGGNGLAAYPVLFGGNEEQKRRFFQYILDKTYCICSN